MSKITFVLVLAAASLAAQPPAEYQPALEAIQARSLEGRLSFLASDLLEGRGTPSRGLDLAAEYIASEFRRAGLKPAGDDGYFQTANWVLLEPPKEGIVLKLEAQGRAVTLSSDQVSANSLKALRFNRTPVYFADSREPEMLKSITAEAVNGKVVLVRLPNRFGDGRGARERHRELMKLLRSLAPLAVLYTERMFPWRPASALTDPETAALATLSAPEAAELFDGAKSGLTQVTISGEVPAPAARPIKLHNVAGLLEGSDPALAATAVLVTAHYDHLGVKPEGEGDRIYNGAEDDGSGTVSVLEIASALAQAKHRPRRSILFVTYFGEELGLLGSQFYSRHPLIPLEKSIANINLEQVGRTDDLSKRHVNEATFTGFEYSTAVPVFIQAGKLTGIKVIRYRNGSSGQPAGDPFFSRSDNVSLARQGVIAHTVCVSLEFPDYHRVSDEWPKIDYQNMARVDRMIALGVLMLADSVVPPEWNQSIPETEPYRKR